MTLALVGLFAFVVGVIVGIGVAPTVYELHGEYILSRFGGEGDDE